jgi:hypothetical protein
MDPEFHAQSRSQMIARWPGQRKGQELVEVGFDRRHEARGGPLRGFGRQIGPDFGEIGFSSVG